MKHKIKRSNKIIFFLFSIIYFCLFSAIISAEKSVSIKQPETIKNYFRFFQVESFIYYSCVKSVSECKVTCNESGTNIFARSQVNHVYYAERKRRIDGDAAGSLVVIEDENIWMSLSRNSSCVFEGMNPRFIQR